MTTEAEALQKMRDLEERIKAPSIWGRTACGIRFEDLQDRRYEEAVKFLKKHYISEELVFRSVKLAEDKEGTDEFIHNARIWMKDKMSIAAVKDGTDKLVGLLIMRIQEKRKYRKNGFSRTFSRVKITYNPNYSTIMQFYNELERPLNLFMKLGVKRYLKIYVLAVKNRYRHRGISKEMLRAAEALARSAVVPALTGFFQTSRVQQIAAEVGFQKMNEIYYTKYYVNEKMVFCDTGLGNYGTALMAYRIPDVVEPKEEIKHQASLRFSISKEGEILGVEEEVEEEQEKEEKNSYD